MAGSPGNDQTVDYIYNTMSAVPGWTVKKQPFEFPFFQETAPPTFEQTAPIPQTFTEDTDFATMTYSGSGDVTGERDGGRTAQRAHRRHARRHDDVGL